MITESEKTFPILTLFVALMLKAKHASDEWRAIQKAPRSVESCLLLLFEIEHQSYEERKKDLHETPF